MNYKHSCVIDAGGFYKTLVLQLVQTQPNGDDMWQVQHYKLSQGDQLIDTQQPTMRIHMGSDGFVAPRWDGTEWVESATATEIAAWEKAHPIPAPPPPTELDKLHEEARLLTARVTALDEQSDFQEELIVELAGVIYA